MFALIAACGGGSAEERNSSDSNAVAIATLTATPISTPTPRPEEVLQGFVYPIEDACLPQGDQLMPNAPRTYRNGTHEGIDFYTVDNCTPIGIGTEILAVKRGRVIRADKDYVSPTLEEMNALLANPENGQALDEFRGRQVWIDHGGGVVTRYCHLGSIDPGIQEGDVVEAGTVLGTAGESGTPESITNPGTEYHLHWEVRVGETYLGAGQGAAEVRALYLALFEP